MRAAFVTSSVSRDAGGLFFAMTRLARCLLDAGCDVVAHGVRDSHSRQDVAEWDPVACHAHARRGPGALAWAPGIAKALADGRFDLIHTHGLWQWPSAAVHFWHQRTRRPYVISPHGMLDPWALVNSRWKKRIASLWYESAHLRDAACLHALCASEAQSMRAYGLRNPVCVIPNGVDLPGETAGRRQEAGDRRQGRKILLFLGRIHPKKGLVNALRAWAEVRRQGTGDKRQEEWIFAIAGWDQGGHEAELKRLCDEIGLGYADIPAAELVGGESPGSVVRGLAALPPSVVLGRSSDERERCCHEPANDLGLRSASLRSSSTKDQGPLPPDSCPLPPDSCPLPPDSCPLTPDPCSLPPDSCPLPPAPCSLPPAPCPLTPDSCSLPPAPCSLPPDSCPLTPDPCSLPPVIFLGPAFGDAKDALLRSADAFILPSFSEGLPMAVLEAWAYRLPVLMTDHCNLPEGFAAGAAIRIGTEVRGQGSGGRDQGAGGGEMAIPIDEGLRVLIAMSDEERRAMGRNGRTLVERQFTWPQVAAQMKEVYEWLLGGGSRPGCVG